VRRASFIKSLLWSILVLMFVPVARAQTCVMNQPAAPSFEELESVEPGDSGSVGRGLHEWAILFHDIRIPECNTTRLRLAYRNKLENELAIGGFQGFLGGGITSFAYASGMILGHNNQLTPEMDKFLGDMPWDGYLKPDCGFSGFRDGQPRWMSGDNCMDDFSVAAEGYAWRAAYFSKTHRPTRAAGDRASAMDLIRRSLLDTEFSICIYDQSGDVSGPTGPCNASVTQLRQSMATGGKVDVVPLNHTMENANYGIGLITSIATAFVGLEAMGQPAGSQFGDFGNRADFDAVMSALFRQGQRAAGNNPSAPNRCDAYANQCYRPEPTDLANPSCPVSTEKYLSASDFLPTRRNRTCTDKDNPDYRLSTYPVATFYEMNGFPKGDGPPAFQFTGDDFPAGIRATLFTDPLGFFGAARHEIYYTFAYDFWRDNRSHRPSFDFDFTPQNLCERPNVILNVPLEVQTKQHIHASINPQPAGTRVDWLYYNTATGDAELDDAGESVELDAGCTANGHDVQNAIILFVRVHSACNSDVVGRSAFINVRQPSALVGNGGTIPAGETFRIPVYLTGIGSWHLKWSDGFEEDVVTINPFRPSFHARTVQPQQTTTYSVTEVTTTGCSGANLGDEFGAATVTVVPNQGKATPVIQVNDVIINAGGQARFTARLSVVSGGYIEGATLNFKVFDKSLGSGITDQNGFASVIGTVDFPPDTYPGAIKVSLAETPAIKAGSGSGNLTIICDLAAFVIQPSALNILADRDTRQDVVVSTSAGCPYTPSVSPDSQSWLHVQPDTPQKGSRTITITADRATTPLPGGSRTGYVFIGSRSVSVQQTQVCTFRFEPSVAYLPFDPTPGSFTFMQVSTAEGCEWTVTTDANWLHLDDFTHVGPGTVKFHVDANNAPNAQSRTAKLFFDKGGSGSVNQYGPGPCVPPHLEIEARGGSVLNGSHIIVSPIFSGTSLRYRIYFNGVAEVDTGLGQVIIARWHSWYPQPGHSASFMVLAQNDCGAALSDNVTWSNDTPAGDSCLVPNVRDHPQSQDSPRPGAFITLGVGAEGPQGQFPDESFHYQWYQGATGDRSSPIDNSDKDVIHVAPQQTSYYWAEIWDDDDACGTPPRRNISATAVVRITGVPRRRTVTHDFTNDGSTDFTWHNQATGQNELWLMNGLQKANAIPLPSSAPTANIQSLGDLNGDEHPDLLVRNTATGQDSVWLMDGVSVGEVKPLETRSDPRWSIGAVADLDGDEQHDIVWHNDVTGENEIWFQNGTEHVGTFALQPTPDGNWGLHGAGDFTHDGKPDLFFHNKATGENAIWGMNDAAPSGMIAHGMSAQEVKRHSLRAVIQPMETQSDTNWMPADIADMDHDGFPDIVWRNTVSGENETWFMNGTTHNSTTAMTEQPDTSWNIGGGGSTNGGGTSGDTRNATSLSATADAAEFDGATIIHATLAANGSPLSARTLVFTLNGNEVARLITDANGSAVSGASVAGIASGTYPNAIAVRFDGDEQYAASSASATLVVAGRQAVVTWNNPDPIAGGTPLGAAQLNASANMPGSFVYSPPAGMILGGGYHLLSVTFTPSDAAVAPVTKNAVLLVNQLTVPIAWASPAPIVYGTTLSSVQLNASTSVPGDFTYDPPAGSVLSLGAQTLHATFTPADDDYTVTTATTTINVVQGSQTITWSTPAPITYGETLTSVQLNARVTASGGAPAGALSYSPALGTLLPAGTHTLTVTAAATPYYPAASASTQLVVRKATPEVTWLAPAAIVYGTPLSSVQLNASADVAGTFTYSPAAGTILDAGSAQTLNVTFTPSSPSYNSVAASVKINVLKATPVITWATPAPIVYGTALSSAQLNATANIAGTFAYTPASGTILDAGTRTLSAHFTPNDTRNYDDATSSVTLDVAKATQTLSWAAPAPIVYGTALSSLQLNATVTVGGPAPAGTLIYSPAAGAVLDAGSRTLTVTAQETANYKPATTSVSINVTRAPLTLVIDAKSKLYGAALPVLTGTLTGVVNGDAITPSYATTATQQSPAGAYPITASLVDPNHRLVNYDPTITPSTLTVTPAPLLIAANPATKQYSDPLPQLTATFTGLVLGETPAVLTGTLSITTSATPLSAPGIYPIAIGGLTSPNYAIAYSGSTLTVTPEDARIAITSPLLLAATPGAPLNVTLTATVKDISATADANGDASAGDIRNATLAFVDRATNNVLCTAPIALIADDDARAGVATCTFTRTFGSSDSSLVVGARAGNYYTRDAAADDVTIAIAPPSQSFVTGSGAIPAGKFNVDLKYDKNGAVKGSFTFSYERNGRKYEVTAATADSLAIALTANGGTAAIVGTATLRDVTSSSPVVLDPAAPFIAIATDDGEPSTRDSLSLFVSKKSGGLWFATSWNGERATPQFVTQGNLQVH